MNIEVRYKMFISWYSQPVMYLQELRVGTERKNYERNSTFSRGGLSISPATTFFSLRTVPSTNIGKFSLKCIICADLQIST